jgi:hypothetical protein
MGCGSSAPSGDMEPDSEAALKQKAADEELAKVKKAEEEEKKKETERLAKIEAERIAEEERLAKIEADRLEAEKKKKEEELRLAKEREQKAKVARELEQAKKFEPYMMFIDNNATEKIILSTMFDKKSNNALISFQPRQLILTNKPCMYYVDMVSKETKGKIEWGGNQNPPFASQVAGSNEFTILANDKRNGSERSYVFRQNSETDAGQNIATWVGAINMFSGK